MVHRFSITLTQLSYFAECAKTLNMTAASQELHVAQSAVSTAISHLERSLGAALFIRQHSKGLILTAAGESLLRDTHRVFGMLSDSIETIQSHQDDVRGTITVACFHTLTPFILPQLLAELQQRHPHLVVEVLEGDSEENLAALRGGRAEISIGYDLTSPDGVDQEVIGSVRPHVILHTDHPLAHRSEVALTELAGEPLVLLDLPDSREYFLDLLTGAGLTPRIAYRTKNYEAVRSLVAMGCGFSILNQRPRIEETYTGNRTAVIEISGDVRSLNVTVSSLSQVAHTARARAVAGAVRALVAGAELAAPEPRGAEPAEQ
ncbi:LysR family transcriptional regulator [Leucobacter luti]|uniref:LysR family transcriptional regulator n=1 Tax=Leucobacter luti TaxID=340320 RepID=A0A4Q7U311_9MICO|nr:LysR family transcriptional regulator [Leucobacter luti]MBL3699120.1 LysR family transcriptional regulator [Leucobacter luti]RZT66622.1 LysR family transcriptional regulator [Leucobacter luti]